MDVLLMGLLGGCLILLTVLMQQTYYYCKETKALLEAVMRKEVQTMMYEEPKFKPDEIATEIIDEFITGNLRKAKDPWFPSNN